VAAELVERIRHVPGAVDAHVHQPADLPRLNVAVDRIKAAEMGLTAQNVANSVLLSLSGSGQVQPAYWLDTRLGVQYLINTRVPEYAMNSIETFRSTPINAGSTGQILANLASISRDKCASGVHALRCRAGH
jgi:Cu/Ag efflux pump CusA